MKKQSSFILFTLFVFFIILFSSCSENEIKCTIIGEVIDRDSDTLVLLKATEGIKAIEVSHYTETVIPIENNHFKYELIIPTTEAYTLIFLDELKKGAMRRILIFPENGTIELTLNSDENYDKNIINGGKIYQQYIDYKKLHDSIFQPHLQPLQDKIHQLLINGEYFSDEINYLNEKMNNTDNLDSIAIINKKIGKLRKTGKDLSIKAQTIDNEINKINLKAIKWRYEYINNHPSIATFYILIKDIKNTWTRNEITEDHIKETFPILAKKFPDHPYTILAKDLINGMDNIRIGGQYIDFSLPDLEGNDVRISTIINSHKVTLLDLWASWCGPCIAKSKSMIPVYEEYKEKGFTILGVAREMNNSEQMVKSIEKYKFTWLNLIELDDQDKVWQKYNVSLSGGSQFLITENGEIVAIDPTAKEVKDYLSNLLN